MSYMRSEERGWENHGCYGEAGKFYEENQKLFLKFFMKENSKAKLLDLGCMDGRFTTKIAESAGADKVYGLEIDNDYVKKAKKIGITVRKADLNKRFPFPNGMFDMVSANQVLEHIWNTDNFFREVNRTLKKGGYAVISTPNLSSFHSMFFILLGQQTPVIHMTDRQVGNFLKGVKVECPGHYKAFNIPVLKDLGEHYGFEVEEIKGFGFYFLPLFIQKLLSKIMGRYAVFITMRIRKVRNLGK